MFSSKSIVEKGGCMVKVMVVDDEIEFLQIMRKFLKDAGFQVVTALNVMDMGEKLKGVSFPRLFFWTL